MRRVEGEELEEVRQYFLMAAEVAQQATCLRARCGAIIIKDNVVVGKGYNGPPNNDESRRTCNEVWHYDKKPKYDKTCCVHAEWRAVIDACKEQGNELGGATLYFMRVDEVGNFTDAGDPFCTTCSRFTLEAGLSEFALWNDEGADVYTTPEYDRRSYDYYSLSH